MTLRRTFDPAFLNQVVNHADVRPWLGQDRASPISMDALVANFENIALVNEYGGFVFVKLGPGIYEVHTQFLPSGRGEKAVNAARQAARYMFKEAHASVLITDVPEDNSGALRLALATGFEQLRDRFDDGGILSGKEQIIHELEMTREQFFKASKGWGSDKITQSEMDRSGLCQLH